MHLYNVGMLVLSLCTIVSIYTCMFMYMYNTYIVQNELLMHYIPVKSFSRSRIGI